MPHASTSCLPLIEDSIEQINDSLGTDLCQDDADKAWYSLGLVIGQVQGLRLLPSKKRRIEGMFLALS